MIDCMKYLSIELSKLLIIFWIHECSLITYNSSLISENILAMLKYSRLFIMICRSVLFLSAIHCTRVLFPIKRYGIRKQRPLWQYGLWSFQMGGTKLQRFLPKNQHTQRILLNFENWVNGEVSKIEHHFSK